MNKHQKRNPKPRKTFSTTQPPKFLTEPSFPKNKGINIMKTNLASTLQ